MSTWIIKDWAGNICFKGEEFETFDEAWDFLYEQYPDDGDLDEDDQEVELRDLDEGEDDDVIHVDDLEKAREKAAKEAKAAFDAEESEK